MKSKLFALALFLIALTVYTYTLRSQEVKSVPEVAIGGIPMAFAGYTATEQTLEPGVVDLLGADQLMLREYRRGEAPPVWLFMGYFAQPKENSQIHSPKHCYPGSGWAIYEESSLTVTLDNETLDAKCLLINNGRHSRVVVYWFRTDTGILTNEYALKLDLMKNALLQKSQRSAFIRFSTPFIEQEGPATARADLIAFIQTIAPHLTTAFSSGDIES